MEKLKNYSIDELNEIKAKLETRINQLEKFNNTYANSDEMKLDQDNLIKVMQNVGEKRKLQNQIALINLCLKNKKS